MVADVVGGGRFRSRRVLRTWGQKSVDTNRQREVQLRPTSNTRTDEEQMATGWRDFGDLEMIKGEKLTIETSELQLNGETLPRRLISALMAISSLVLGSPSSPIGTHMAGLCAAAS